MVLDLEEANYVSDYILVEEIEMSLLINLLKLVLTDLILIKI